MCSVGSGMVLAIGDLAGATFITLLAATATQFARAGRLYWSWGRGVNNRRRPIRHRTMSVGRAVLISRAGR